ncbi:MAG TPA: substrate-binding domain-containing protein [Streptosporangiaceae bacterium]|nr:substrate-binding domain-containing protein [Streptosporangiaceae bacterium]
MTAPLPGRSKATRRRKRRVRTKPWVFAALAACLALTVGRGAAQVVSSISCSSHYQLINVAVSPDIAPAIQQIAQVFNRQRHQAGGQCIAVQVNPEAPAQAAAQIDGEHSAAGQPAIDAWIPDSSLWVDKVRGYAIGAQTVNPSGFSVALSPLMIVMPQAAATKTAAFGKTGWQLLLPRSAGGPVVPKNFRVDLPDPSQSAAGLATLIEMSRLLGPGQAARVKFTKFVYSATITSPFDDAASLTSLVSLAAPPLDGEPATITTEQAVLGYDLANPRQPLAATYPTGQTSALGSPEMDYPYVQTTTDHLRIAASSVFGTMLRGRYAASVIRFYGFRSAGRPAGVPGQFPASFGLADQLLQVAPPASAVEEPSALQSWNKLILGSRDLALIDVSAVMAKPASPSDPTGPTIEKELTQAASLGLGLFADTASIGLWEFADHLTGQLPYRQLVSIGPLPARLGVLTRRDQLQNVAVKLTPTGGPTVALYGSILDAYKYMRKTYQPKYFNTVVVLASGLETAPGDITAPALIRKLTAMANPDRRIAIIIIVFGSPPNFPDLQRIADATGGQAYEITSADQVGKVFYQALAHRLCDPGCAAA